MKVDILGAYGGDTDGTHVTTLVVDDFLAIDAGSLTSRLPMSRQNKLTDVLVSHTHMDHICTLPFLVDNLFEALHEPLRIWASDSSIEALKDHIFNGKIWPDFAQIPNAQDPAIRYHELVAEKTLSLRHLRVTPIPVTHIIPCFGYLVESTQSNASILFTADTTNTDRIWEIANACENLKAVIVDCSFPNRMRQLAEVSGHMTPEMLAEDLDKLKVPCDIYVYHLKPSFEEEMIDELKQLGRPRLHYRIESLSLRYEAEIMNSKS